MERIDRAALDRYLASDEIAACSVPEPAGLRFTSQRWLDETPAKRLVFWKLYGDLLASPSGRTVLDVGGGLTALTPALSHNVRYTLVDPLVHETDEALAAACRANNFEVARSDWQEWAGAARFDIVIANDLFPNVDQRLELFLSWALPRAGEIRLSLTFHNTPRWYPTLRIGSDERLTVLAFDGARTAAALEPFAARFRGWNPDLFRGDEGSVFPNGRQVVIATLDGDAK